MRRLLCLLTGHKVRFGSVVCARCGTFPGLRRER